MVSKHQIALLLCGAALLLHATAQTTTDTRWFVGIGGGLNGGESTGFMANEGDRRFISGYFKGAGNDGKSEYNEFVWSDGTWSRQVAGNNAFVAKVTSDQDIKWHRPPRRCYNDEAGTRVCDSKDNFYFNMDGDSVSANLVDMGAGDGRAVTLLKGTPIANAYTFQQVANDGWTTVISAEDTRVPKAGTSTAFPTTWGETVDAKGTLDLKFSTSTNGRFYALFAYTGNVRIGKTEYGKMGTTYIVKANGTYVQLSNVDRYDIDDGVSKRRTGFTGTPLSQAEYAPSWVARKGYLLVSLNIVTGNVEWVMPIWEQGTANWKIVQVASSKYDHAMYIHFDGLSNRVMFGNPFKFDNNNYVLDNGFAAGSGTTIAPPVDNWSGKTYTQFESDYDTANTYKYLMRIDVDGSVKQPYKVLHTDKAGGITASTATPNRNTRTYSRSAGTQWFIGAADDSTNVFVATVYRQTTTQQLIVGGGNIPKFYIGGLADYYTQLVKTDATTYYYDSQDLFTAAFDGASLDSANGPKWVGQMMGWNDAPTVKFVAGSANRMYVQGTFGNTSYYGSGVMFAKTTTKSDQYVLTISAGDGGFVDAGTMSSTLVGSIEVDDFATAGERVYLYGTFKGQMALDVLNSDRPGLTAHPRVATGSAIYMATFAKDLAKSEGSEREPVDNKPLRLGLGIGLGLGIPVLIALCVAAFMLMKGGSGGGSGFGGKVEPA